METATPRARQAGDLADAQGVRSIRRALDILSLLTDGVSSVSKDKMSSARRMLRTP